MRGERRFWFDDETMAIGSSPHARGTRRQKKSTPDLRTVHPRMRGERFTFTQNTTVNVGSSPHARGTRHELNAKILECRFIPACAGNALLSGSDKVPMTVHPRMRGERHQRALHRTDQAGSSPHARGTHTAVFRQGKNTRFIPACAGNAGHSCAISHRVPVHPRMRGERIARIQCGIMGVGSSPHARGTR